VRLSVLDQSPVPEGCTPGEALRNSIDLARLTESLGYRRYWVAEHHGSSGVACNSPEVLIGPIAASTTTIRVGSGGVMLPHYSPLKVAESFSMLTGLFPARIDLGLGRAAGTSPMIARALQRDRRQPPPDDFREQLDELIRYFTVPEPAAGPFPRALTARFESPAMWLLGSSPQSAVWAAELGLPYVFADFINPHGADIARAYRQEFRPSERLAAPHSGVAAWVICAPTDEEAVRLSASLQMMMTMLFRGQTIPVPPVEKALRFLEEDGQSAELGSPMRRVIRGSPETVAAGLKALAEDYEADEVFAVNILHDHQARRRSYELLAEAVGVENTDATIA
jgi:luciferase family oxidoreductase group 1